MTKCAACDVRLKAREVYFCAACAAEHDAGYSAERRYWLARLRYILRFMAIRELHRLQYETLKAAPRAAWTVLSSLLFALLMPSLAHAQSLSSQLENQKPNLSGPIWALIVANAADAASTEIALQRPQIREGNPVLGQSLSQRLILKSAGTVATVWMTKKLGRAHPRLATVTGYSVAGAISLVAAHNVRIGR